MMSVNSPKYKVMSAAMDGVEAQLRELGYDRITSAKLEASDSGLVVSVYVGLTPDQLESLEGVVK